MVFIIDSTFQTLVSLHQDLYFILYEIYIYIYICSQHFHITPWLCEILNPMESFIEKAATSIELHLLKYKTQNSFTYLPKHLNGRYSGAGPKIRLQLFGIEVILPPFD